MSKRTDICKALSDKFKTISVANGFKVDLWENSEPKLRFWDEVSNFPAIYVCAGLELRDYLPGNFRWSHFNVAIKVYCKGDNAQDELQNLLDDVEKILEENNNLPFGNAGEKTTEIRISRITTDEGLLDPYAVGEIAITLQYQTFV